MLYISITLAIFVYLCWRSIHFLNYWKWKGVKQNLYDSMFLGLLRLISQNKSVPEIIESDYNMFPQCRYSGLYQFFIPALLIRDPDLIKEITVKNFDHFVDHSGFSGEDIDPLWSNNLFSLTGQKWRETRATLSPAFTSSKMKFMFSLISQNGERFVKHFMKEKNDIVVVEMKDIFTRFTNDVIANTAFGIECDSLDEPENEFYLMGNEATNPAGFFENLKMIILVLFPKLYKLSGAKIISNKVRNFFINLVKNNIESREKNGIVRPDMMHLLLQARYRYQQEEDSVIKDAGFATVQEFNLPKASQRHKREITEIEITSQALIFFFAGFDTVSTLMCFMAYELAINPDIQAKLIKEVDETREFCENNLTYEAITGMKYLDMVVSETLRKWPNAIVFDRVCTKPYTIQPKLPYEKAVDLEVGSHVLIPLWGIHRDAKYWPEPERFDPERFSDENKDKIKPCTFIPFGSGPRNCIGSRFALLETKTLFYYILNNFQIVPIEKTPIPLILDKKKFQLGAENGFWLGFQKRVVI